MGKVIGIIVVLALAIFMAVLTCKSKHNDLFKWVGIVIFIAFCFTWVLPYGQFQSGTFYEAGMNRLGLNDIPQLLYYAIYFCLTTVLYLFAIGGFYGVLSKTKSYQALVKKWSKFITGKELPVSIILIILLVALTSVLKSTLILLVFVPFLISVLLNAKFDKVTTMGLTFGSILVGSIAGTYGTDSLYWFNNYANSAVTVGIYHRLIISLIALALFIGYNIYRVLKMKKVKSKDAGIDDDPFVIEDIKGKTKAWPMVVIFAFLFIFVILGYINWNANWGIEAFNKFHTWLTELSIGKEFNLFSYILGTNSVAFGMMEISNMIVVLILLSILAASIGRLKPSEFVLSFCEGLGKVIRPVCLYALTYVIFIITYMTPFVPTITDWAFGLTKKFNPFIALLTGFISSIFHSDLGYTSYLVSSVLTVKYASDFNLLHTIYVTTYGLVQIFVPISGLLLFGLAYLKLDYKSWFKYIWIFALAMLVVMLIFVAIVKYAM